MLVDTRGPHSPLSLRWKVLSFSELNEGPTKEFKANRPTLPSSIKRYARMFLVRDQDSTVVADVSEREVRAQLDRILQSAIFKNSERVQAF
jgi:hypothetical protein